MEKDNTLNHISREAWIDNVKMVAMLFVILGHTWRIIHCPLPDWLGLFILSFNMALFVIMTGYTSVKAICRIKDLNDLRDYFFKITKRIMLPSAVFGLFLSIIVHLQEYLLEGTIPTRRLLFMVCMTCVVTSYVAIFFLRRKSDKWKLMFDIMCVLAIPLSLKYSSFWFLNMIWCVCFSVAIASILTKKCGVVLERLGDALLLYLFAFLISMAFNIAHDKTSDFVHFFIIGYVLSKYELLKYLDNVICMILSLLLGIAIVSFLGTEGMNFWDFHFIELLRQDSLHVYYLRILASTSIGLFFILLTKKMTGAYNWFSYWGSKSLPLYMVHAFFINILYKMPIYYELFDFYYLLYAIPAMVALTFVSIMVIKLFMKFELTQAYCLGEMKKI